MISQSQPLAELLPWYFIFADPDLFVHNPLPTGLVAILPVFQYLLK